MTTRAPRAVLIKPNLFSQEFFSCRLESETCVANQTLKDEKCLVPCDGLYADIADDSDNQNMKKGKKAFTVALYLILILITGLQLLKRYMAAWHQEELSVALEQIFPNSSADMLTLTKAYQKYKREYVKHLAFDPEAENLSKQCVHNFLLQ